MKQCYFFFNNVHYLLVSESSRKHIWEFFFWYLLLKSSTKIWSSNIRRYLRENYDARKTGALCGYFKPWLLIFMLGNNTMWRRKIFRYVYVLFSLHNEIHKKWRFFWEEVAGSSTAICCNSYGKHNFRIITATYAYCILHRVHSHRHSLTILVQNLVVLGSFSMHILTCSKPPKNTRSGEGFANSAILKW